MKKIFYLASIAALAFSSCTKDETTGAVIDTVGGSKIVAAMEADDTRSELVESGAGYEIVWKATDGLSVFSNGSGAEALPNVLFQLDNASDGLAAGAFNSKVATLNAKNKYVAVYPYSDDYGFTPTWDRVEYPSVPGYETKGLLAHDEIELTIPATQIYVPGSFNTNTIAAISTEFTVGEDNTASVKMQPVVDYLLVDIAATEPINTLSLNLYKGTAVDANLVKLAGTAPLSAYKVGDKTRYILESDNISGSDIIANKTITLETKQLAGEVSLATPNTYVFVIPGGILGDMNGIVAEIYVNGRLGANKLSFDVDGNGKDDVSNINYYGAPNNPIYRSKNADDDFTSYNDLVYYNYNRENTVFYLNAKNAAGERVPYVYNPNGDALIEDELDLLRYIINYEDEQNDAYVAENAKFDFSVDHMSEILRHKENIESDLRTAINDYIMPDGSFPVIEEYANQFRGNGAVISNIERPLAEMTGLFGVVEGTSAKSAYVRDITLANVVAATDKVNGEVVKGVVLASEISTDASITNITVAKLNADAVIGAGTDANYKQIKVGEAGLGNALNHIVEVMTMNGDLSFSAEDWAAKSAVAESVFNTIIPGDGNGKSSDNATRNDKHQVASLPETAKYEKFVEEVDYEGVADNTVVSVMIGNESYWTGGKINTAAPATGTTKPRLVQFAEQFANGEIDAVAHKLTRNMNFEYVDWTETVEYTTLDGGDNTVTGLNYVVDEDNYNADSVAPFSIETIKNVVFDGLNVSIKTTTTNTVPRLISGISNNLETVDGVTINNLVINAYSEDSNNTVTDAVYNANQSLRHVGWLAANANNDIAVYDTTVNGVDSNVIALSAMVSWIHVQTNNSIFDGSKVTGKIVKAKDQVDIKEFTRYNGSKGQSNMMGTLVAFIESDSKANVGVKFNNFGSVKPVALYQVTDVAEGYAINILYNNKLAVSLYHKDDKRNE